MAMAVNEATVLTLANICLDVQIGICMFLHPSDLLAIRKTCKALQLSTRQRAVWVAALYRVCLDNSLFLPSFPISDMSDLEIEKAAMGPRRWIELCGAFEKQHLNDHGVILCPRTTRVINSSFAEVDYYIYQFFMVPGGRYAVGSSSDCISVLDLGYTSSADCKLIASVEPEGGSNTCIVQATPDGMGLTIFSSNSTNCSVYELYPHIETPHLTQIAHLDFDPSKEPIAYLLPGTVIWYDHYADRFIFRVWDYRLNHSICFSVFVFVDFNSKFFKVMATKTAIIVLREEAISIWAIPPLSSQPPDFFNDNPAYSPPPLFTIPFPYEIAFRSELIGWNSISSWYPDSLYFDMLCHDSKLHRFQIMLKPDLSTVSLHVVNLHIPRDFGHVYFEDYRICDDTLVSCWNYYDDPRQDFPCGVYTGLTSARFADVISDGGPAAKMYFPDIGLDYRLFLCPASGRCVRMDENDTVAILDFF